MFDRWNGPGVLYDQAQVIPAMAIFSLNLTLTLPAESPLDGVMPQTRRTLDRIGLLARERWADKIQQAKLPQEVKAEYIASLTIESSGPMQVSVYSDYEQAYNIENGQPSRDMKRMLDTSMKVRVSTSKKNAGKRYLVIPFRHTLNAMPAPVQATAKLLLKSSVVGMGVRQSGTGAWSPKTRAPYLVPRRIYKWGDRLPAGLAMKSSAGHKTDRYAGMVRMGTSAGKGRSSAYLTFRTMMEGSSGWITKPVPGIYQVKQVVQEIEPIAKAMLEDALRSPARA